MALETPVTVWLSEEEYAALVVAAARYQQTPETLMRAWIADDLADARKQFAVRQWDRRRRVLEQDAVLAATVDAKVSE